MTTVKYEEILEYNMTKKRILVLNGHPAESSLSKLFAETYAKAAKAAGNDVRSVHLSDLDFDADHGFGGYQTHKPLEACLTQFQADLEWSEHIVLTTPMWWGGLPAKLKGLFDRTLLPGWAFDTRQMKRGMPTPLLTGRTARVFVTSDTPQFFFRLLYRTALFHQIKGQIFAFVGINPTQITHFSPVGEADGGKVERWSKKVACLGKLGQ